MWTCLICSLRNKPDFLFFLVFLVAFSVSLLTIWLTFLNSQNRLFSASLMVSENLDVLSFGGVAEWLKAADCKSARIAYVGSNPTPTTILTRPCVYVGIWPMLIKHNRQFVQQRTKNMSKEKFDRSKPHCNIGTIVMLTMARRR